MDESPGLAGRPAAADLHLLPPGAADREPGGADAADRGRAVSTAEIARAFLVAEATMSQRLLRAKGKIAHAGIPYRVPAPEQLAERTGGVLAVLYLVFNEGYGRREADLAAEALRLSRLLVDLMPARGRGARPARAGAAPAGPPGHPVRRERRPGADGGAGPVPLGRGDGRRGSLASPSRGIVGTTAGSVPAAGRDRGVPRGGGRRRVDGLGPDRHAVRRPGRGAALGRDRPEPGDRLGLPQRLPGGPGRPGRPGPDPRRLLPAAGRPRRLPAPAGSVGGSADGVHGGAGARAGRGRAHGSWSAGSPSSDASGGSVRGARCTASATGVSPETTFHCFPAVAGLSRTAASTAATSARGMSPRRTPEPSATRPVAGLVGEPSGPDDRPVQAARRGAPTSASRFASTYARQTSPVSSGSGSSTLMAETWTKRRIPASRAPSIDFSEPSRSTVRLRSMLPSGPPPAANTTASQPSNAAAKAAASCCSMSSSRTSAPRCSSSSR